MFFSVFAPHSDQFLKVVWKFAVEMHVFACGWMYESKGFRMKSLAWTNNSDFYIDINNSFKNMHVDNVTPLFSELIISGYKRKPMEEFSYLKENITLAWYWQFFIIIGNIIISFFLS